MLDDKELQEIYGHFESGRGILPDRTIEHGLKLISTIEGLKGEVETLQTRFQELRKCHTCPDCKDI